jgi:hypothetical protein
LADDPDALCCAAIRASSLLRKLPDDPYGLASPPTMRRWENAPTMRLLVRLTDTLVDVYGASYRAPPADVPLEIDDTVDVVHGA